MGNTKSDFPRNEISSPIDSPDSNHDKLGLKGMPTITNQLCQEETIIFSAEALKMNRFK